MSAGKGILLVITVTGTAMALMVLVEALLTARHVKLRIPWTGIALISINALVSAAVLWLLKPLINNALTLVVMLLIAALVYCLISFINKPFPKKDAEFFKKAGKAGRLFAFFGKLED